MQVLCRTRKILPQSIDTCSGGLGESLGSMVQARLRCCLENGPGRTRTSQGVCKRSEKAKARRPFTRTQRHSLVTEHHMLPRSSTHRPVGPMDKASASGAGDSRFESWAGHFLCNTSITTATGPKQKVRWKTTARGFEPLRAEPNGFLVHHLSHSVTVSHADGEVGSLPSLLGRARTCM